ncbi:MAG: ribosome maturation factor RimM [Treponema sp.]|nr:ribosome maturation factor RimM [Treponema sp.]
MTESFIAAVAGAPFGLKGFIKVRPFSGETAHLLKLQSVTVRQDGRERVLKIAESVLQPPGLALRFEGFDSPEAAAGLSGAELLVKREDACPLQDGEFYIEDLKGLAVTAADDGRILGYVTGIIEGGGGFLAELRLPDGVLRLVPFRQEFFTEISPEEGRLILKNLWILE